MTRIPPLPEDALGHLHDHVAMLEASMGFVPNNTGVMARVPGLVEAMGNLTQAVFVNDLLPRTLRPLVALVASAASGCRYCQAHTAYSSSRLGVSDEKLADVWNFEQSPLFDDAERAALRLALAAAGVPNGANEQHFEDLRQFYSEDQITGLVAVVAMFGFMNRWNDTLATELEDGPAEVQRRLAEHTK